MLRLRLVLRLIPSSMRRLGIFVLAVPWLVILSPAAAAFDVIQITNNSTDDVDPAISGSNVVWRGCDGGVGYFCDGGDFEIYLWSGGTITNISNNSTDDWSPAISGSNIVWDASDGNDYEIYLWGNGTILNITNDSTGDRDPAISGSNVVWRNQEFHDPYIHLLRGVEPPPRAVPSVSFGGLALLAGLVLGIVAWTRRSR